MPSRTQAVIRIARCWRRYVCQREYRFKRDLLVRRPPGGVMRFDWVHHHHLLTRSGDYQPTQTTDVIRSAPKTLRFEKPTEAFFVNDRGARVHLRLRLGPGLLGKYPYDHPVIYYRIFTHHPVQDLNQQSPEDYFEENKAKASERAAAALKTSVSQKGFKIKTENEIRKRTNKYVRVERNDWRVLSGRAVRALAPAGTEFRVGYHTLAMEERVAARRSRPLRVSSSASSSPRPARNTLSAVNPVRVTNRGVRTPVGAVTLHSALRLRARAWSAGGDVREACCFTRHDESDALYFDESNVSADENENVSGAESVDSLLRWSQGLDFEESDEE